MRRYEDETMAPLPLTLPPGERQIVPIVQDESTFHANDQKRDAWLAQGSQPLRRKGFGRAVHVSDFLCEDSRSGRLSFTDDQWARLCASGPPSVRKDARVVTYPGKGHDKWWDGEQLLKQTKEAIEIFNYLFPNCIGLWIFDCSSAHEAFAKDALNINKMNVKPGGKNVPSMHNTVIPWTNPDPPPGVPDSRGSIQSMNYPIDYHNETLRGKPKGILAVLRERTNVWAELERRTGGKVPGICHNCSLSQAKRDAAVRVATAELNGLAPNEQDEEAALTGEGESAVDAWCCAKRVLSLQEDFQTEKPELQILIENAGHICIFLPKFHCELNPIELYWGYAKYSKSILLYFIVIHN